MGSIVGTLVQQANSAAASTSSWSAAEADSVTQYVASSTIGKAALQLLSNPYTLSWAKLTIHTVKEIVQSMWDQLAALLSPLTKQGAEALSSAWNWANQKAPHSAFDWLKRNVVVSGDLRSRNLLSVGMTFSRVSGADDRIKWGRKFHVQQVQQYSAELALNLPTATV